MLISRALLSFVMGAIKSFFLLPHQAKHALMSINTKSIQVESLKKKKNLPLNTRILLGWYRLPNVWITCIICFFLTGWDFLFQRLVFTKKPGLRDSLSIGVGQHLHQPFMLESCV